MPLRITVPFGVGETPFSFASRLAARNGLSAREFCLDFGVTFQSVVDGNAGAIATISRLGGVDPAALAAHSFIRGKKHAFEHRGERLVRNALRRSWVHVCPACLIGDIRNDPTLAPKLAVYHRSTWLIGAIKTCAIHDIGLVRITADLAPKNLHDFSHHAEPAVPHLDQLAEQAPRRRPSGLETYALSRLDGARGFPFLDSLDLFAAIRTCEMIGAVETFGRTANLKRLADDDWWRAGAAGFDIAAGGPPAIGEFLTRLQHTYPYGRGGNEGPQALFGRLYQFLEFGAEDRAYDHVRAVVGRHIRDHLPVGPGDLVFGSPVLERTLHSVRSLSLESGLHPKRLKKVLRAAGIIGDDQMGRTYQNAVFGSDRASSVIRQAKGALSLVKAGKYLNAPRAQAERLAKNRFIVPFLPAKAFSGADQYAIADLDYFRRRLLDGAHPVRKPKSGHATIPAAAKRACCSAAAIVRLILDRKLDWVGRQVGIGGYLSALVDVDEIRANVRGEDHGGLTPRQVASLMETNDKVVSALIATGDLTSSTVINPLNRCPQTIVSPEELAKFQKKYVSLFVLAKERHRHIKAVKNDLDAAGVEPAFKPKEIGATFYRRSACQRKT
jgi:hypothetical protein